MQNFKKLLYYIMHSFLMNINSLIYILVFYIKRVFGKKLYLKDSCLEKKAFKSRNVCYYNII